jgi:hypothetical protein
MTFSTFIWKLFFSNLGRKTGWPDFCRGFLPYLHANVGSSGLSRSVYDHIFQVIFHLLTHHSALRSPVRDSVRVWSQNYHRPSSFLSHKWSLSASLRLSYPQLHVEMWDSLLYFRNNRNHEGSRSYHFRSHEGSRSYHFRSHEGSRSYHFTKLRYFMRLLHSQSYGGHAF